MAARITQADIAERLGISTATVSLALRGHARIPAATVKRIRDCAAELGYRVDPLTSALASYRWPERDNSSTANIVVLCDQDMTRKHEGLPWWLAGYRKGMRRACKSLGYSLVLRLTGPKQQVNDAVLAHHQTCGLILCPPWEASVGNIDWTRYNTVAIGAETDIPAVDRITLNMQSLTRQLCQRLQQLGYQKPVYMGLSHLEQRMRGLWLGALTAAAYDQDLALCPPLLADSMNVLSKQSAMHLQQYGADVIITHDANTLKGLGRQTVKAYGQVLLHKRNQDHRFAGFKRFPERRGEAAIHRLDYHLRHLHIGLPDLPQDVQTPARWCDGASLPARV